MGGTDNIDIEEIAKDIEQEIEEDGRRQNPEDDPEPELRVHIRKERERRQIWQAGGAEEMLEILKEYHFRIPTAKRILQKARNFHEQKRLLENARRFLQEDRIMQAAGLMAAYTINVKESRPAIHEREMRRGSKLRTYIEWKSDQEQGKHTIKDILLKTADQLSRNEFVEASATVKKAKEKVIEEAAPYPLFLLVAEVLEFTYPDQEFEASYYDATFEALRPGELESVLERYTETESRNKVYMITKLLPGIVFFAKKYTDHSIMKREVLYSDMFLQKIGHSIQQPVAVSRDERDQTILTVMRSAGDRTLDHMIERGQKRKLKMVLRQAAVMLARIHVLGTEVYRRGLPPGSSSINEIDIEAPRKGEDHFKERIKRMLSADDMCSGTICRGALEKIIDSYNPVDNVLTGAPKEFYKDHNPRNIVIDGLDRITCIDFESSRMAPPQIDLISLLEFGAAYAGQRTRDVVVKEYLQEVARLRRKEPDVQQFMELYSYARVQRHLEMIGYRTRDSKKAQDPAKVQAEIRRKKYHAMQAAESVRNLMEHADMETRRRMRGVYEGTAEIEKACHP